MKRASSTLSRLFFRGLGIVLPLGLTVALLLWLWNFLSTTIFERVDDAIVRALAAAGMGDSIPGAIRIWISVALIVVLILLMGWWFSGFIGRRVVEFFERALSRVPIFGAIYPYVKQVTEFFFGEERKVEFERVVAIPYPRTGVYSLGFLTGSCLRTLNEARGHELISVFVPSSPMPATGYTLFVPAADIIPINIGVEEALRAVISGGVLVPPSEKVEPSSLAKRLVDSPSTAPSVEEPKGGAE
ncbi:MAG: DUF502 domain-containing protein [Planctomycetota bacterium]|jgi:uncharacterized membrane protein|nr:DUF502 domain-containing protein [Planctomycetota bacterium]MDP6940951.1 DUF502 domain-containing protein [Planctomycetota bacterium]